MAAWEADPASSLSKRLSVRCLDAQLIGQIYAIARGVATGIAEIDTDTAILALWTEIMQCTDTEDVEELGGWWGFFLGDAWHA